MKHFEAFRLAQELGKYIRGDIPDLLSLRADEAGSIKTLDDGITGRVPTTDVDSILFYLAEFPKSMESRQRASEVLGWLAQCLPEKRINHWLDLTVRDCADKHSAAYGFFRALPDANKYDDDPLCCMLDKLNYFNHPKPSHGMLSVLFSKREAFEKPWFKDVLKKCFRSEAFNPGSQLTKEALDEFQGHPRRYEIIGVAIKEKIDILRFIGSNTSENFKTEIKDISNALKSNDAAMDVLRDIHTQQTVKQKNIP